LLWAGLEEQSGSQKNRPGILEAQYMRRKVTKRINNALLPLFTVCSSLLAFYRPSLPELAIQINLIPSKCGARPNPFAYYRTLP
jgi:hypothetical protein